MVAVSLKKNFFKQKTAYEISLGLVGSEMCIRDSMSTAEGSLIIRGESLHIEKLSLDGGDLLVEGTVDSLTYEEEEPRQGSFLGRLFRG